ncbi:hypothetical protein HPB49_013066 [Dermacentor silvarum]|uniref:Uncharacterized protein n=1 Tax=Dermacentor silvarum TaxID=543639 RepID=A0ACB8CRE1_DERSI|nr:hypothetical protein HPB49_013066 [Dermacentor silvarum]
MKNFIDRSTLSTVKNNVPIKVSKIAINQLERLLSNNGKLVFECTALVDAQVTKATIGLGSIIEDICASNAECKPRGAKCSKGHCLCKQSPPMSLKAELRKGAYVEHDIRRQKTLTLTGDFLNRHRRYRDSRRNQRGQLSSQSGTSSQGETKQQPPFVCDICKTSFLRRNARTSLPREDPRQDWV